jgi:hypothetical protein
MESGYVEGKSAGLDAPAIQSLLKVAIVHNGRKE